MTIITEYRWKCDYDKCGAVSPPVRIGEGPLGWVVAFPRLIATLDEIKKNDYVAEFEFISHFCCENHREQWEAAHK